MSITRIKSYGLSDGAVTTEKISNNVSLGVKISNIQIANSAYSVLDDTAVALEGGYLVITGAGFAAGCQVIVGSNTATSTTFVNSTTLRAQVGAADAGTKTVYVVNTDGGTAIRVNGLTYSATPTWVTGSSLTGGVDEEISIQLDASLATSYQLQTGSSLPAGLSLAANGLLTGTVTGIESETTYNFVVEAIDAENQESPRSFSITITAGDPYFYLTTLLLNGNGTNGANNNTFVDSSNNNFAITRNGNVAQGTFSPFAAPDGRWSAYFDGSGDYLSIADNAAFNMGTGNFTAEFWLYTVDQTNSYPGIISASTYNDTGSISVRYDNTGHAKKIFVYLFGASPGDPLVTSSTYEFNQWIHVAIVRDSATTIKIYVNGVLDGTGTVSSGQVVDFSGNNSFYVGRGFDVDGNSAYYAGTISNVRLVKGTAVYTSAFTPSTSPLTSITNTSLLTCQSNRFKDNSTNNFTITRNGDVKVTSFSPFAPTGIYSAATNGGSGYFDGTGDYLTSAQNSAFNLGTGAFTVEAFFYVNSFSVANRIIGLGNGANGSSPATYTGWSLNYSTSFVNFYKFDGSETNRSASVTVTTGQWYHLVACRDSSSNFALFLNGNRVLSESSATTSYNNVNSDPLYLGRVDDGAGGFSTKIINAYVGSTRVVAGSTVYDPTQTTLVVPTAPLTAISNTSLLLNFTNGGIIDYTGKNNLETVGNAQISTSVKKYGTGSLAFDGTGDYLSCPTFNAGLNPESGDFTVEFWAYIPSLPNREEAIVATMTSSGTGLLIGLAGGGNVNKMQIGIGNLSVVNPTVVSSSNFPTTTWTHVAAVRQSGTIYLYINGTSVGTPTSATGTISQPTLTIGNWPPGTASFNGFIDDLRITKGFARYTSNFTPPTSAHRLR